MPVEILKCDYFTKIDELNLKSFVQVKFFKIKK